MQDDVLGSLTEEDDGSLIGSVMYLGREMEFRLQLDTVGLPDMADLPECLAFARTIVSNLGAIEEKARIAAARDFLESYNDSWRHTVTKDEWGAFVETAKPELDAAQFGAKLSVSSLAIYNSDGVEVFLDDARMFGGHVLIVSFGSSLDPVDAQTEMFG